VALGAGEITTIQEEFDKMMESYLPHGLEDEFALRQMHLKGRVEKDKILAKLTEQRLEIEKALSNRRAQNAGVY